MTLTNQQQQVLDRLLAETAARANPGPVADLLTLVGASPAALREWAGRALDAKDALQAQFLGWIEHNPMDSAFGFLGAAALAFYQAEQGVNPKIRSYIDAFYYISTCASVGYADVFATTQSGKAIAAVVMVLGPALAAKALDGHH